MADGSCAPEAQLRRMASTRIADESLPVMFPVSMCPQHGSGEMRQVCDQQIGRYRIEYQVADARDGYALAFHLLCYRAWQFECRCLFVRAHGEPESRVCAGPFNQRSSSQPW